MLEGSGWLAGRDAPFRAALLTRASIRTFVPDEALYRSGDAPNGLFGVVDGTVRISVPSDDGQEFDAHRSGTGFWIGDLAHMADSPRLVSVTAVTALRAAFVPANRLQDMVRDEPRHYRDFYALTYENMALALRLLGNLAIMHKSDRLALRLLHLHETSADAEGWIHIGQAELAAMTTISRPTLHRILADLARDGLVELGYGRLRVTDPAALGRLAHC